MFSKPWLNTWLVAYQKAEKVHMLNCTKSNTTHHSLPKAEKATNTNPTHTYLIILLAFVSDHHSHKAGQSLRCDQSQSHRGLT